MNHAEHNGGANRLPITPHGIPVVEQQEINTQLPEFEHTGEVLFIKIDVPRYGEVTFHHFNTMVVLYDDEDSDFGHMDHVVVIDPEQFDGPLYIFPDANIEDSRKSYSDRITGDDTRSDEQFDELVSTLKEHDFPILHPPKTPFPYVLERYYSQIREDVSLDAILERIIDEAV